MSTARQRRNRFWALSAASLAVLAAGASAVVQARETARALHVYLGLVAALLFLFAVLLGLRKRYLRLRLGSISAWASAHLWLGALALYFGLLHSRFRAGSPLGVALFICLLLVVASGLVGVVLQSIVPRLMTSRLADESPLDDLEPVFAEQAQRIAALIARTREQRHESDPGRIALEKFHEGTLVPFFRSPLSQHTLLAHEAEASLAFDALRAGVDTSLHEAVDELRTICDQARVRSEEGRLRRSLQWWLWVHIPASMFALALLAAHALAAVYF